MLNTAVIYGRSLIAVILTLFSSRWVLSALGQTDFGLYSVVGSIIVFITVINTVMAGSVARHYAYAIGHGVPGDVSRWFNVALVIHLGLAAALVAAGWPAGEYAIARILTVPPERMPACLLVFRVSLLAAFFSMVSMPFTAMFTARQRLAEQAGWLMAQSLMVFLLAMRLGNAAGDRLIFYAVGMVAIIVCIQVGQIIYAAAVFKDCRISPRYWRDRPRYREVVAFAGWNLFGILGGTIRDQGSAILLNLHFGPKVNAAYGIANQVSVAANMLTNSMIGALAPEMTSSEGRGDRDRMLFLAQSASKLGTLLIMAFTVPLIAEMDYVLQLWLRAPPAFAALFCQLILTAMLIDRMSAGAMLAVSAHGRIAAYQATLGTCVFLTLPLAWLFLKSGAPPTSIGIAFIVTASIVTAGRALWMRRLLGVAVGQWVGNVLAPCVLAGLAGLAALAAPRLLLAPSPARLALTTVAAFAALILSAWFLALDGRERAFFRQNALKLLGKLALRRSLDPP